MACLDEKPDVGVHEADCHGDVLPIWKDGTPVSSALLDEAEDIIPTKEILTRHSNQNICYTNRPQFKPEEWFLNSKRISSIWNAAGRVSIRTVPRIVLCGMPI